MELINITVKIGLTALAFELNYVYYSCLVLKSVAGVEQQLRFIDFLYVICFGWSWRLEGATGSTSGGGGEDGGLPQGWLSGGWMQGGHPTVAI